MMRVVLVDDRAGSRGQILDLGITPTGDPDPGSALNRGLVALLLRRNAAVVWPHHVLLVNIDTQPCTWLPVATLLGTERGQRP